MQSNSVGTIDDVGNSVGYKEGFVDGKAEGTSDGTVEGGTLGIAGGRVKLTLRNLPSSINLSTSTQNTVSNSSLVGAASRTLCFGHTQIWRSELVSSIASSRKC